MTAAFKTAAEMKAEADREERICTCGAGHGSLEGHMDWCEFVIEKSHSLTPEEQSLSEAIGLGVGGRGVAEY